MSSKVYQLVGIDTAVKMLRPGARWELYNNTFTIWDDPRPCPSIDEVMETVEKIKAFEDSINTIWLPEQLEEMGIKDKQLELAVADDN
jgi:hypothetical protein